MLRKECFYYSLLGGGTHSVDKFGVGNLNLGRQSCGIALLEGR